MTRRFAICFLRADSGAVTVDWVVLSGAAVGLALIVLVPFAYSTDDATRRVAGQINAVSSSLGSD